MNEEKIDKITEECWDFVKFFMNNAAAIWETGNLAIKKDVQSLISPKGFVFRAGLIELKETPHFISSFGKKKAQNQIRWRRRELNPRPKMLWYCRYRLSFEVFLIYNAVSKRDYVINELRFSFILSRRNARPKTNLLLTFYPYSRYLR